MSRALAHQGPEAHGTIRGMDEDAIRLRQPARDELTAWIRPANAAFGDILSPVEFEHDSRKLELDRLIGALDGDAWVGTAGAYSLRLTVPGGRDVGAAGITEVGVAPSHRRRGILRRMMTWLCDQALERGEPVAVLWASESAIYQRFGFGLGTLQSMFDMERTRIRFIRPAEPAGRIRLVEHDEALRLIPPVYEAARLGIPGAITRSPVKWDIELLFDAEWMHRGNGPKFMAVLEADGEVRGYALYRMLPQWEDRGPNNSLLVLEVIGLDHAAERTIWGWLTELDLLGHVRAWRGPVPHPLILELTEPRRMGLVVREGLWLRILDVAAALEGRGYASAGSLAFELTDEFRPANAGRWRLTAGSGPDDRATVGRSDDEPDLALDVSDLATVYLGAFRFADLARSGRVRECRPGAIADADRLFASTATAWCSTMF
jgi:predicted acetyltransferase